MSLLLQVWEDSSLEWTERRCCVQGSIYVPAPAVSGDQSSPYTSIYHKFLLAPIIEAVDESTTSPVPVPANGSSQFVESTPRDTPTITGRAESKYKFLKNIRQFISRWKTKAYPECAKLNHHIQPDRNVSHRRLNPGKWGAKAWWWFSRTLPSHRTRPKSSRCNEYMNEFRDYIGDQVRELLLLIGRSVLMPSSQNYSFFFTNSQHTQRSS